MRVRVSFVLALFLCSAAWAAPMLDQYQITTDGGAAFADGLSRGQTFTAGLSGKLTQVDLGMDIGFGGNPRPDYPSTVEVRTIASDLPTDTILGSVFMPDGFSYGWNSIDFSSQNVQVVTGTTYAIVVWNDEVPPAGPIGPEYSNWLRVNWDGTSYPAGQLVTDTGTGWYFGPGQADAQFRTYVDPAYAIPAPSALALAGLGSVLGAWLRKRRTR